MGFQSLALDSAEQIFTISNLCGHDDNCRTIETSAGYVIINIARKPQIGDTILIAFCGRLDFAKVQGRALITQDGEAIEGDSLDDATTVGVVTYFLNQVTDTDDRPVI
ncbi:hypothetical protein L8R18_02010 [Enterobacter kobei]|uniref:hypothetical protein n=1 Tax=Enterobacter cloacae complex TaxID=354276 RepID=UPI0007B3436C|nr:MULTISPECIES: hypothetical protein [Enterobacter cloacae complex]KZP52013.1 hypothetical protein A3N37_17395 [Enterobacter ludwigii]MCK6867355.1 hypothetical protein [Enterobacter kobei]